MRRRCKCHGIARLVFLVAPAANHRRGGALEGHSAGMEIRGRGFCGALVGNNRGQSRVLSFFSFPRPCQAAAESEKSRADALSPPSATPEAKDQVHFIVSGAGAGVSASRDELAPLCGRGGFGPFYSRGFASFAVSSGTAGDCRCYNDLILPRASANHGNTELIDTEQF
jgi:hypothetical protein